MAVATISRESVLDAVRRYGDNPSGFLAVNEGNDYFQLPGEPGVIAYRACGRYLVQFGGPFAPQRSYPALQQAFVDFAAAQGKAVTAVQLQRRDAEICTAHGFTVNQVGASYAIRLDDFTLHGTRFMRLRNKISRARRTGLTVVEADFGEYQEAISGIDQAWLASKGENVRQLEFLVGQRGGPMQQYRRLFIGLLDGTAVAYISYSPAYGQRPGWLHDLSRHLPGTTPGVMEAVNATAIEVFRAAQVRWLHLGFTPFTSLAAEHEVPGASRAYGWFMSWLWENGSFVYPAQSQLAYKQKWAPHDVIPEYVGFYGPVQAAGLIHIFKAANAF
jgi:lysylphosphatidylglycerol synthetase-like protein (DUF2156 family)